MRGAANNDCIDGGARMAGRGKPHQKIVVAYARELAGFVWAIATEQPLRTR